jgi:hypothetical protein
MRTELRTFIAFSALALSMAALPLMAAEVDALRVTVPFTFLAGRAVLPAGEYLISQQTDNHILTIAGKGGDAMVVVWPAGSATNLKTSALTFERTNKGNMLTEVNLSGSTSDLVRTRSTVK